MGWCWWEPLADTVQGTHIDIVTICDCDVTIVTDINIGGINLFQSVFKLYCKWKVHAATEFGVV